MREVITPTFDVRRDWQEEPGESSLSAQLRVQGERYLKVCLYNSSPSHRITVMSWLIHSSPRNPDEGASNKAKARRQTPTRHQCRLGMMRMKRENPNFRTVLQIPPRRIRTRTARSFRRTSDGKATVVGDTR